GQVRGNTTFRQPGKGSMPQNSFVRPDHAGPGGAGADPPRSSFDRSPRAQMPQRVQPPRFMGEPRYRPPQHFEPAPRPLGPRFGGGPMSHPPSAPRFMPA